MRADAAAFTASTRLFDAIGKVRLRDGREAREALRADGLVSLWDVVAPFVTLYRFPLLFDRDGRPRPGRRRPSLLWAARGAVAQARDLLTPAPSIPAARAEPPPGGRHAVFLGFAPHFYRDALAAAAHELHARHQFTGIAVTDIPLSRTREFFAEGDVAVRPLAELWSDAWEPERRAMLRELVTVSAELIDALRPGAGPGLDPGLDLAAVRHELRWLGWREFRRLARYLVIARRWLGSVRPALVVTPDDADQRARAFSLVAASLGIPVLVVQQGITAADYPEWRYFAADHIALMGPGSRAALLAQGVPEARMTVTGHPGFDRLVHPPADSVAATRAACGVPVGDRMVLFASQPAYPGAFRSPEARREMMSAAFRAIRACAGARLVVKPHPSDELPEIQALAREVPGAIVVDNRMAIADLIVACDVFVTFFSQTGIEALIAGKPVINVRFPGSIGDSFYLESGATFIAESEAAIGALLAHLTGPGLAAELDGRRAARHNLLQDWAWIPDGRAAERVGAVAVALAGRKTQ